MFDLRDIPRWRRVRVIALIRKQFPGAWHYDRREHRWVNDVGWAIERRACLSPRYDGDDDTFVLRYFRTDTGEEVHL